ncbi:MAG: hypothetical protein K5892_02530, partial [Acholeplasmatales bacterium]|nr:hypothetical protein [Acholeplasmatales bacterium]
EQLALSYDNVIKTKLYLNAMQNHFTYMHKKECKSIKNLKFEYALTSWFKQKSNLYFIYGMYPKKELLNKIKADYVKEDFKDYSNLILKDKFSIRDVLAFQEHERWCAFEIGFGVLPMKIEEVVDRSNEYLVNQISTLYHSCICTQKGLVDYYNCFSKKEFTYKGQKYIFKNNKGYKDNADVICYDYELVDYLIKN